MLYFLVCPPNTWAQRMNSVIGHVFVGAVTSGNLTNTRHLPNVGIVLGQCRGLWSNAITVLGQCLFVVSLDLMWLSRAVRAAGWQAVQQGGHDSTGPVTIDPGLPLFAHNDTGQTFGGVEFGPGARRRYMTAADTAGGHTSNKHHTLNQCCSKAGQRRRRWTSFRTTLSQCFEFAGQVHL